MAEDQGGEGTTSPGENKIRRRKEPGNSVDDQIHVSRQVFTSSQLRSKLCYTPPEELSLLKRAAHSLRSSVSCSPGKLWALLLLRVPILAWLPRYKYKENLLPDIIAGLTVGVMHLPQGMGYAMLAEVPPIIGLYSGFFPVMGYVIFGTSRHISMGTFAVGVLMTGQIVVRYASPTPEHHTNATGLAGTGNSTGMSGADEFFFSHVEVATATAFMVGVWQMIFGILHLGKVSVLLPDMLISGFSTGAAVHVFSSQVKNVLGIKLKRHDGPFYIIALYREIFTLLPKTNFATLIASAICIAVMGTYNEVFKARLRKVSRLPIPVDLFVLIIGTSVTHYCQLDKTYGLAVVGHIPTGLPPATFPKYRLFVPMLVDTFVLAIVVYAIGFSMAKIFSKKHGYKVDSTQELYAAGISNIFGSFFSVVPSCASVSRSTVQDNAGGVTQVVSLVSCSVLLVVLLFVGPAFESLPICVLASIIIVAVKTLFMHVFECVEMWKHSKEEALLWIVTCLSVALVDVDYGVGIGVVFNVLLQIKRNSKPTVTRLGWVPKTDIYVDIHTYQSTLPVPGACLCNVSGALHSANIEHFREQLIIASGIDTTKIIAAKAKREKRENKEKKKAALHNLPTDGGITTTPQNTAEKGVFSTAGGSPRNRRDQIIPIENSGHNRRSQEIKDELANMFRRGSSGSYSFEEGQKAGVAKEKAEQGHDNKAYHPDDVHETYSDLKARPSGVLKPSTHSSKGPLVLEQDLSYVVLCLSGVGWIDVSAAKDLGELYKEHKAADIILALAGTNDAVMKKLLRCGVLDIIPEQCFYISLHDAVTSLVADLLYSKTQPSPVVGAMDDIKDIPPNHHDARAAVVPAMFNSHALALTPGSQAPIQLRASNQEHNGMEGAAEDIEVTDADFNTRL